MSPEELNKAVSQESGEENIPAGSESTEEPASLFEPVTPETGEGAGENKVVAEKTEKTETTEPLTKNEAVYKALMKELVNSGVLTVEEVEQLDELPGTLDTIKELVSKTVETGVKQTQENWKKSLDPTKKRFLEIEDAFDATDQAILMAQRLEFFDSVKAEDVQADVISKNRFTLNCSSLKTFLIKML